MTGAAGALANDAARDAAAHEVAVAEARATHAQETVALEAGRAAAELERSSAAVLWSGAEENSRGAANE